VCVCICQLTLAYDESCVCVCVCVYMRVHHSYANAFAGGRHDNAVSCKFGQNGLVRLDIFTFRYEYVGNSMSP